MNNGTNDLLKWGIFGILALTLVTPFYVADSIYFPFIGGKAFYFRILVEIAFALWLILALRDRTYLPKSNWLIGLVSLFTLSTLVSLFLGENPLKSFWSNYERMEGWIMIVHLLAYFTVLFSVVRNRREWHWLMNVSIGVAFVIGLYCVGQYIGVNSWVGESMPRLAETFSRAFPVSQSADRVDARLGNSIYLAVYMIIHLFMAGYLFYNSEDKTIRGGRALGVFYSIFALLTLFAIFHTQTRGAILGTIAGLSVSALTVVIWGKGMVRKVGITGIAVVFVLGLVFVANRNTDFVQNNPTLRRMATISWSDTKTQARSIIWPMAVEGALERPVFGWGQENFNYIFNEKYVPALHSHEKWFDRAHSVYIDWLVAGGILGLGLYLSLYVMAFYYVFKSDLSVSKKAALYGLLVGYAVHNVFAFDNISSYIIFFFLLAFIAHVYTSRTDYKEGNIGKKIGDYLRKLNLHEDVVNYLATPVIVIAGVSAIYFLNLIPIGENQNLVMATRSCGLGKPDASLYFSAIDRGSASGLRGIMHTNLGLQEAREQTIMCATRVLLDPSVPESARNTYLTLAEKAIADQIEEAPNDARIYFFAGGMYNKLGEWDKALLYTKKGYELSPNKQQFAFEYGLSLLNSSDKTKDPLTGKTHREQGVEILKKAYESGPEYFDSQTNYGASLIFTNNLKEFDRLFGTSTSVLNDPKIIGTLVGTEQYDRAIKIYRERLEREPTNYQIHFSIGAIYLKAGKTWEAIAELRKVSAKDKSLADEVEKTVKDILEGKVKI